MGSCNEGASSPPCLVLILGAGGHGMVVADILSRCFEAQGLFRPVGFLDDATDLSGSLVLGLPVLGSIDKLASKHYDATVVAIGANRARSLVFLRLLEQSIRVVTAIHPRATVAPDVRVEAGTVMCAGVVVNPGTRVGSNVILNTGATIDHHNVIGDHAHVAPGVHLGGNVEVGSGALIGIGATVMPGLTVGAWAQVGAGAVVNRDVPPGETVVGVPARRLRPRDRDV